MEVFYMENKKYLQLKKIPVKYLHMECIKKLSFIINNLIDNLPREDH